MVDWLKDEDDYHCATYSDPKLWHERETTAAAAQQRHKKRRLASQYSDRSKDSSRHSMSSPVFGLINANSNNEGSDGIIDLVSATPTCAPDNKDANDRQQPCPGCGQSKIINKECSLHLCKKCCSNSSQHCKLTAHMRTKTIGAPKPYLETSLAK